MRRVFIYQLSLKAEGAPGSKVTARSEPLGIDALNMERIYARPADEGGMFGCLQVLRAPGSRDVKVDDGIHVADEMLAHIYASMVLKRGDAVEVDVVLPPSGRLDFVIMGRGTGDSE